MQHSTKSIRRTLYPRFALNAMVAVVLAWVIDVGTTQAQLIFKNRTSADSQATLRDWDVQVFALYDSRWGNPIVVKITSLGGPVKQDVSWTVLYRSSNYSYDGNTTLKKTLVIPKGNDHGTVLLDSGGDQLFELIGCVRGNLEINHFIETGVRSDGQIFQVEPVLTFQARIIQTDRQSYGGNTDYSLNSAVQKALDQIFSENANYDPGSEYEQAFNGAIHPADFDEHRIIKRGLGRMTTTLTDLSRMSKDYPEKTNALRKAIEGGLSLVVLCDAINSSVLDELERILNQPGGRSEFDWMNLNKIQINRDGFPRYQKYLSRPESYKQPYTRDSTEISESAKNRFAYAKTGQGAVMLVSVGDLDGQFVRWDGLRSLLSESATTLMETNTYQWIEIPGIGKRPVSLFMIMVIVFVVLSGPVLFTVLVLRKQRNLYWIGLPLCSLVATAAVFLYVLATDGVGLQGASTGTFLINQRSGFTSRSLNHSLYATSISNGEVTWNETSRVLLESQTLDSPSIEMNYRDDGQVAIGGQGVASRSIMHFFESDLENQNAGINIVKSNSGNSSEPLRALNSLGCDAEFIYIRDQKNQHWFAENCEDGQTISFEQIKSPEFKDLMKYDRKQLIAKFPDVPSLIDAYQQFRIEATNFSGNSTGPIYVAIVDQAPQGHGPFEPVNWRMQKYLVLGLLEQPAK